MIILDPWVGLAIAGGAVSVLKVTKGIRFSNTMTPVKHPCYP